MTTAIDQAGVYYRVPICCIQNPDGYEIDAVMDAMKSKKAPKEKQLNVSPHHHTEDNRREYAVPFHCFAIDQDS